jgi:hypothetical protein
LISESGLQPLLCAQLLNAESSLKVLLSRSLSSLLISQRRLEAHLAPSNTRLLVSQRSLHTLLCAKPLRLKRSLKIGLTGSKPSRLIEPLSLQPLLSHQLLASLCRRQILLADLHTRRLIGESRLQSLLCA